MIAALDNQARHCPVFAVQPSDTYVREFREHIALTGYPETFRHVSTSKPGTGDNLVFLSEEITVNVDLREDGRRVPCPYCSGNHPKFKTGRIAWFPDEQAVRFIGHFCARTHNPEGYSAAERRFRIHAACRRYIALWPDLQARRPVLLEFVNALRGVADDAQFIREKLDHDAPRFADYFRNEIAQKGGELFVTENLGMKDRNGNAVVQRKSIGRAQGMSLFDEDFEPKTALRLCMLAINDLSLPLPQWKPTMEKDEPTNEILRRGGAMEKAIRQLAIIRDGLADAQQFFEAKNLRAITRWATAADNGAFSEFELKRDARQLLLRARSLKGAFYANIMVPETTFDKLPDAAVVTMIERPISAHTERKAA